MSPLDTFTVWDLIEKLGAPEFGLISQAILAACFKSLGAANISANQTGHPDIEFDYQSKHWRVEAEFAHKNKFDFEIKYEDIEATKPLSIIDTGSLAILDCNYPVNWILIDTKKLLLEGLGFHSMNKLKALSNVELSKLCTKWSITFFAEHQEEIISKRYPGICRDYIFSR